MAVRRRRLTPAERALRGALAAAKSTRERGRRMGADERKARRFNVVATLAHRMPDVRAWEVALDSAQLFRLAATHDRYTTEACNRELSESEQARWGRTQDRIATLAYRYGATAHLHNDPRGVTTRLYWPDMIPIGADPDAYTDRMLGVEV